MKVYKFGGASIEDAQGIKNIASIIQKCDTKLVLVVSAMGKTTNALERLVEHYFQKNNWKSCYHEVLSFHRSILEELFLPDERHGLLHRFFRFEKELLKELSKAPSLNFDFDYDRIVSYGELFSTSIIAAFFEKAGLRVGWLDSREFIRTSNDFREAKVDWQLSETLIKERVTFKDVDVYLTQGFIGSTTTNQTTTLGREGSDFTAAVIANLLNVTDVTIWKDVAGVLNADPRWYEKATLLPEMSYNEAIELSFYGAQVIHPKTLKPLENKKIPLYVRSFKDVHLQGTTIGSLSEKLSSPILIKKTNQILLSIAPLDFSFIVEENLREIFETFSKFRVKVNQMQISALSVSVCASYDARKFEGLLIEFQKKYRLTYNQDIELLTIRHHNPSIIAEMLQDQSILMEQKNRDTAWFVLKQRN